MTVVGPRIIDTSTPRAVEHQGDATAQGIGTTIFCTHHAIEGSDHRLEAIVIHQKILGIERRMGLLLEEGVFVASCQTEGKDQTCYDCFETFHLLYI